jgi:hypothetical protein
MAMFSPHHHVEDAPGVTGPAEKCWVYLDAEHVVEAAGLMDMLVEDNNVIQALVRLFQATILPKTCNSL